MLPDWMIEELEQERRAREERSPRRLELEIVPVPADHVPPDADAVEGGVQRGVVTFDVL